MRAAAAALAAFLAAAPSFAQAQARAIQFGEDTGGYGFSLVSGTMRSSVEAWSREGRQTRLAVAEVALNGDGQPEFAVRVENSETCDRYGCLTFVFMLVGREWEPVFQAKTTALALGPRDQQSGMASLHSDGATAWAWDGQRYDVLQ